MLTAFGGNNRHGTPYHEDIKWLREGRHCRTGVYEKATGISRWLLGFRARRELLLTPQFFTNKPLDLLFRPGVRAEMFNRFKLGRTLDEVHAYGCDPLLSELALARCAQERLEQRFHHLDTTSFSLSGNYVPASDKQAIRITHGYSTDHRPDLKQ